MRRILLFAVLIGGIATLNAQEYHPTDKGSSVKVIIKNSGMDTDGRFTGLDGSIRFNPGDLTTAQFSVSVEAASINTEIEPRDIALRGPEYLDAARFPRISFESKRITQIDKTLTYQVRGIVIIKGIRKEVTFPFTVSGQPDGILFSGTMKLNRRDFNIGTGSVVLSESFNVVLSVFAKKV